MIISRSTITGPIGLAATPWVSERGPTNVAISVTNTDPPDTVIFAALEIRLTPLRHAHGSINKVTRTVEADETLTDGKARNMYAGKRAEKIRQRGPMGKAIVFG